MIVFVYDKHGLLVDRFRPLNLFLSRWDRDDEFLTRATGDGLMPEGGRIEIYAQ